MNRTALLSMAFAAGAVLLGGLGAVRMQDASEGLRYAAGGARAAGFAAYDVRIDSGEAALGAYQVQVWSPEGGVKIVGIEGGDAAPYAVAPHYDPLAMEQDRVVIAAYSTLAGAELPKGKVRVARIHVRHEGEAPTLRITLAAAANENGTRIQASAEVSRITQQEPGPAAD